MNYPCKIKTINLNLFYGEFQALKNINIKIPPKNITAIIGPSGCGKSTLLRCFNRMNDLIESVRTEGKVIIDNQNINLPETDLISLRRKVGMVFQRPNVFDLSVYENLAFGVKIHRLYRSKTKILEEIEHALESVGLWKELKDKLKKNAKNLTLDQQQRLCIARVIILKPEIILLDEPCSSLDPIATLKIEELLFQLKEKYTIVIVTHNMQQAARISQFCGFMLLGELVEFDTTEKIFTYPSDTRTENYITGKFG
ncbi:MAG: phosphate ABC transporter ATP-binding protein [Candidatus Omnitrophota bacterium]|nr:MAG: phosphate ABC transporter ATP-binding protein [Candidatus Omnitrophota bacterium]RKY45168.1 MAG: phosphate ABC transporter ATP-binding protein [Candidatus Omnitrophota bacterium]HDN85662.1 phosphate ABC transporter ATP-binding protein [Candidatus Omnitrophota bacterium]